MLSPSCCTLHPSGRPVAVVAVVVAADPLLPLPLPLSCRRYIPNFSSIGRRYVDLGDAKNERSSTITDNIDTTKRRNSGRGNRLTLFLPCLFFLLVVFVSCLFDLFSLRAFALLLHCFPVSYHRTYTYTLRSPCCSFLSITH